MPDGPEEEGAFLVGPEAGEEEADGEVTAGVAPDVFIFEIVVVEGEVEAGEDCEYGGGLDDESPAALEAPGVFGGFVSGGDADGVTDGCDQGSDECQYGEEVS